MVDDGDQLERLRLRVAEQNVALRATCLRSKELRARAAAVGDQARAVLLWVRSSNATAGQRRSCAALRVRVRVRSGGWG